MSLEKILSKIQVQIKELAPTLELFVEHTIHPSVRDCEKLQGQLSELQEHLAVYKHHKLDKEISPSYNIHVKVSEQQKETPAAAPKPEVKAPEVKPEPKEISAPVEKAHSPGVKKSFVVGINDKFRFINELFAQNSSEYHIAMEQINNVTSWYEAEIYLNSLKNVYGWKDNQDVVKYFFSLVKKRFD